MDDDSLAEESSQPEAEPPKSLAEIFYGLCPAYMNMGMTHEQFWNSNTKVHRAYREAHEMRMRQDEWARWRQGAYFYDALLRVAPVMRAALSKNKVEPGKYPEDPWPLTEKEARALEERRERLNFKRFIEQMEAESERNRRQRLESAQKEAGKDG